jgi:hypothetical protein
MQLTHYLVPACPIQFLFIFFCRYQVGETGRCFSVCACVRAPRGTKARVYKANLFWPLVRDQNLLFVHFWWLHFQDCLATAMLWAVWSLTVCLHAVKFSSVQEDVWVEKRACLDSWDPACTSLKCMCICSKLEYSSLLFSNLVYYNFLKKKLEK